MNAKMESSNQNSGKLIRNSSAKFLIFSAQGAKNTIEVRFEDETIWLSQKMMAELFSVDVRTINEHLQNIYNQNELSREASIRKFRIVQSEGKRNLNRLVDFHNLDAVISVGYRVNSVRATQFRQWAIQVLKRFAIRGYVIDKKRMENGTYLNEAYFERLLEEIREIRHGERRFYQKITDIYATSIDNNKNEIDSLGRIVNAYLALAEERAKQIIPLTMKDWAHRLNAFLEADDREVLSDSGSITAKTAKDYAEWSSKSTDLYRSSCFNQILIK